MKALGILIILMFALTVEAKPSADKLLRDFEKAKNSLLQDEMKQRQVMGSLYSINKTMKKAVAEKATLEQERMLVEAQTKELAGKVLELDAKVKSQKSMLRMRLGTIYKLGGSGLASLLMTSQNSAQLERNLKILGVVAKKDFSLIKDYTANVDELQKKKTRFTNRLAHLRKLEARIQDKEKSLLAENQAKSKLLDKLRGSKQAAIKTIKTLRNKSMNASFTSEEAEMLDLILRPSFFEKKGKLQKPVPGPVVQGFGLIKDSHHDVVISHKGIFLGASRGVPVKAVSEGRVAFSGEVPGFGNTVILDHGDHYYSVYAHAGQISVTEGEEVSQSQVVALAGSGSSDYGDGIYFEIRHFSEPVDPRQWMKGTRL